ncbi:non-ribosomal peptide synthetase [Streptomyces sp. NBC_01217]|uniref:non-ribosomal peptide synthetase n=1 Tax=Streptomyces sp. NBC_01217 TaxID=2903779 RepID=UPI002E0F3050|nr:non-ribosomal peptide synthetase [Streptomyces sp. NBC_01217]WSQ61176.1 amino acid adenylation domain-containing protein [Streptomyces sp. NBC_01217]
MDSGASDVLGRFREAALRHPGRTAVSTPSGDLTYRELDDRVERIAAALRERAVTPGAAVAVCLPRCADLVAAMLAVWRTGAAYVPLDPAQPAGRLEFLSKDAGACWVITSGRLDTPLPRDLGRLDLDTGPGLRPDGPGPEAPEPSFTGASPAYIMHTSGTTGRPKGVVVTRNNVAHLLRALERSGLFPEEPSRVVWNAAPGFDASVQQWIRVCRGDTLILPTDELRDDPELFAGFLREQRATDLDATPSHWEVLRPHLIEGGFGNTALRLFLGGEPVPAPMWTDLVELTGRGLLSAVNVYGPTECTVDATAARIAGPVPHIGSALPGVRAHVLDAALEPVAEGQVGELHLAGEGVASGYAGRPGATAERFLADPLGPPGSRMYRTGDCVRRLAGGLLEYLGRSDRQVKLRGQRIEPGEIEEVLARHPEVGRAVVVAREDRPGDRRLVAYVTTGERAGRAALPASLRAHCAAWLPSSMVPAAVLVLDGFPVTANGKTDLSALPAPEYASATRGRAPASLRETLLCRLFAEVLGAQHADADTHFFDAGGNSLLAMRLVGRARAEKLAELTVRDVFEAPTPAALADRLGTGPDARADRLITGPARRPELRPVPRPDPLPLSPAQRRLWFLDQLEGPNPTYNEHVAFRFSGTLDAAALEAATGDVVARHEPLRTVFPGHGGEPRQHILGPRTHAPRFDVREVSGDALAGALREAVRTPFDLTTEPPLRAVLFVLDQQVYVLLLVMHHIASDGWSLRPLARDLAVAYRARRTGAPPAWSQLPVQYADYTLWQSVLLGSDEDPDSLMASQLDYWKSELKGLPEIIPLPVDGPRAVAKTRPGGSVPFACDADLHGALAALAREQRCSLFMVMQAALAVLLTRLGAGSDIPIGTVTAGRDDPLLEDLVGFFVNTLVLRTDTSGDPGFRELLSRVRETGLAASEHQDLPFDRLVEALNPARTQGGRPLFQVLLAFQNTDEAVWDFGDVEMQTQSVTPGTAKFDLALSVGESRTGDASPGGLSGFLEYSADLFTARTAEGISARLVQVLETAVTDPDRPIGSYDLLTEGERQRLLDEWNTTTDTTPVRSLLERFEEQAGSAPDSTAVLFEQERVSYAELDTRANRLAAHLLARGVGPGAVVASALTRSVELIVAVLAVMKTGAAYLPVDPEYPAERIAQVLDDAGPALLLTTRGTAPGIGATDGLVRVELDGPEARAAMRDHRPPQRPHGGPRAVLHRESPAYVIYTSGSTGRPKGVVVTHAGLANLAEHQARTLGVVRTSHVLQFASPGFDAFFWEVAMALSAGAALVMAPARRLLPGPDLRSVIARHGVTHLTLPPSVLGALPPDTLTGVHTLVVAGEALGAEQVRRRQPGRTLINAYGPTETTVCASMSGPLTADGRTPPIGRPIRNTRLYVLDERLRPAPTGVVGELYIAGAGLAQGYLKRPGTTAERFVADPYGAPGTRMYRTGDLARWNTGGELEFAGRVDHQVKVRGHRIELTEIEELIAAHPEVSGVAVKVDGDRDFDRRIISYVVPKAPATDSAPPTDSERVAEWGRIHDSVHSGGPAADFGEDFTGWHSSYDGGVIAPQEMRQWRDATVRDIIALRPARVLELGVGSGLLLSRIAPSTDTYWGFDLSRDVIGRLHREVAQRPELDGRTVLRCQAADDATGIPRGFFDVVVLNSVTQYFPSGDYLTRVLKQAATALAPGGSLFVGDVRNLRLLRCFHAATAARRTGAEPGSPAHEQAVRRSLAREQELLVAPDFFGALAASCGLFSSCDVRLKRGGYHNELSRYRYDVILRTSPIRGAATPVPGVRWGKDVHALHEIRERLRADRSTGLRVLGIPNARLSEDLRTLGITRPDAVDPEELARFAEGLGHRVALRWSEESGPECFDVVIAPPGDGVTGDPPLPAVPGPGSGLDSYVNVPFAAPDRSGLGESVLKHCAAALPAFMVPSAVVVLESLPLTPNGKTDRRALPAPDFGRSAGSRTARTPREAALCRMYGEILGLGEVGIDDSFFDLGGHSLLVTRLVSRIRAAFGVEVAVSTVFDAPSVAALVDRLDDVPRARPALRRMRPRN